MAAAGKTLCISDICVEDIVTPQEAFQEFSLCCNSAATGGLRPLIIEMDCTHSTNSLMPFVSGQFPCITNCIGSKEKPLNHRIALFDYVSLTRARISVTADFDLGILRRLIGIFREKSGLKVDSFPAFFRSVSAPSPPAIQAKVRPLYHAETFLSCI